MRYLRIWLFDANGSPISTGSLSSALLPRARVPITGRISRDYAGALPKPRRELAARILLNEQKRAKPLFRGVMVAACPDREARIGRRAQALFAGARPKLTAHNAYSSSVCAVSPEGQLVAGDWIYPSLPAVLREGRKIVEEVLGRRARKPREETPKGAVK